MVDRINIKLSELKELVKHCEFHSTVSDCKTVCYSVFNGSNTYEGIYVELD